MKIDKKLIKELTDYLNEFGLTELEYGDKDTKIKVSKSSSVSSPAINYNVSTSDGKKTTQLNASTICPNSPYKELLLKSAKEIANNYNVDGFYFDEVSFQSWCNCINMVFDRSNAFIISISNPCHDIMERRVIYKHIDTHVWIS